MCQKSCVGFMLEDCEVWSLDFCFKGDGGGSLPPVAVSLPGSESTSGSSAQLWSYFSPCTLVLQFPFLKSVGL